MPEKKIEIVLVYKFDHFGRSLRDVLNNIGRPTRTTEPGIVPHLANTILIRSSNQFVKSRRQWRE
jgi:hypothetical protein